ncbi:MAG: tonB-dependent Receptor Plug domain protein [Pseudoduganella sp.]|jgi:iron complex outermembrane receptor protein|nr:tonB-dependent Receptor Plug domain protein [Pseudoduganella sp.]
MKVLAYCVLLAAGPVLAQEPAALTAVHILGQGQARQVQNITRDDLAAALPGASPLKTLEKLPGVSFQSSDVFGAYEWSTRFGIRGFSQGQLGFTLDGVPLGNMSYGNNNGLHISRAITPENLRQVELSQGSGAVGTASTSNLGGTVQFFSADPTGQAGVSASQAVGSHHTRRTLLRYESSDGWYASAVQQHAEKWKGSGPQDLRQFNIKYLKRSGALSVRAFYDFADRAETDYQDLSLDMQRRLGWMWDNYAPDWERSVLAARGIFSGGVNNLDDGYYAARGLRRDHLAYASLGYVPEAAGWNASATLYLHRNRGQGHWYTPYTPTSANDPISIRTTEYAINRRGLLAEASRVAGRHTLRGGFWIERNVHDLARRYYPATGPEDTNRFLDNPFLTTFDQRFDVDTVQFHLQDTMLFFDERLQVVVGVKRPRVTIDAASMNAVRAAGTLTSKKSLLPQVGLVFDVNRQLDLFASVAKNMRAFEPGVYGQFSQSQEAFDLGANRLRPETSRTADAGVRFQRSGLAASLGLYATSFRNRLLSVATCAGVVGCPNTVVNVGRVSARGAEAALHWTLQRHWSWFNSLTFNDARYRSDYFDQGQLVPVSGKRVVDSPRLMWHTEAAYDDRKWFARLAGKYTGPRYYSYTNVGRVPGFAIWNLSGGYRWQSWQLQLQVVNMFNKRHFATIGSNQFVATDPAGTFATLLTGAPREIFISIGFKL